jgi:hypothetical protein
MGFSLGSGVCRACGCTDDEACEDGCFWVDPEHTLCSQCASKEARSPAPARQRARAERGERPAGRGVVLLNEGDDE